MVQLDILYLNMYGWMLGVTHYISNILTIQTTLQHCSTGTPLWDCLSEKWDQINSSAFLDLRSERNNVGYCCCCVLTVVFSCGGWTTGHTAQWHLIRKGELVSQTINNPPCSLWNTTPGRSLVQTWTVLRLHISACYRLYRLINNCDVCFLNQARNLCNH